MPTINTRLACPECFKSGSDYWILMPTNQMEIGAPLCPIHQCTLWTDEDFRTSKEMGKIVRSTDKPLNICQFIARHSGMKPTPDLVQVVERNGRQWNKCWIKGGKGRLLFDHSGNTIADMHERVIEAGYLSDESYESDLLDAIDETLSGNPFYTSNDLGTIAEIEEMERSAT